MKSNEDLVDIKAIKEIMENRSKILEDFARAYLASLPEGTPISKLELVETREGGTSPYNYVYTYSFRLKRGRPKKEKKNYKLLKEVQG